MDPIILFDMDNTLCDWDGAMRRDLRPIVPPQYTEEIEKWFGENRRDRPEWAQNLMMVIRTQTGWWRNLRELPLGMKLLRLVLHTDWDTHILTKGPATKPQAWAEKVEWCRAHIVRQVPLTICSDKSMVYGKALVDDYPPYVEHWLKHRPNGLVIMPAQPYNKDFHHPNVLRISDQGEMDIQRATEALWTAFNRKEGEPLVLKEAL